jgi:hypothetical protein
MEPPKHPPLAHTPANPPLSESLHSPPASCHPRHVDKGRQLQSFRTPEAESLEKSARSNLGVLGPP